MKNLPTVSIITPCYNSVSWLPACMESLTSQSIGMENLEFIFVDDASSDDTLAVLEDFEARFPEQVILIPLAENQGQGFARNLALTYASGDYVLYVDSDDAIAPYALELLLKHAASLNCDILEFDFTHADHNSRFPRTGNNPLDTAKHCRIKRGIQIRNLVIATIHRHGILGQIIGPDTEEIHFLGKNIGNKGCGSRLHHNTNLNILIIFNSLTIHL